MNIENADHEKENNNVGVDISLAVGPEEIAKPVENELGTEISPAVGVGEIVTPEEKLKSFARSGTALKTGGIDDGDVMTKFILDINN